MAQIMPVSLFTAVSYTHLVQQGGVSAVEEKVTDIGKTFSETDFSEGQLILKKGKKVFHKVTL